MKKYSLIIALFAGLFPLSSNAQVVEYYPESSYTVGQQIVYEQLPSFAPAQQYYAANPYEASMANSKIRCGTNLSITSYARFKDGKWSGIDADFCRIFAQALLGDSEKFELLHIEKDNIANALNTKVIDVMLSGAPSSADFEISGDATNAGLLYYDYQMFMSRDDNSDDLEDYRGKKVCVASDSEYFQTAEDYNQNYNLGFHYLKFDNFAGAKQAFLLKRCDLMTAGSLELRGLANIGVKDKKILPHKVALHPVYAYVQANNNVVRLAIKWIINALYLAEQYDINTKNLDYHLAGNSLEINNLLGRDERLWAKLGVRPLWLRDVIKKFGNYSDIYERNFGDDSEYPLERNEGKLLKNGGIVHPLPFI